MEKFSIVIPVYNEGKNLGILIPKIYKELKKEKFELIIVDDNSTDNTSEILKKKKIFITSLEKGRDLSKSCVLGFEKSRCKI